MKWLICLQAGASLFPVPEGRLPSVKGLKAQSEYVVKSIAARLSLGRGTFGLAEMSPTSLQSTTYTNSGTGKLTLLIMLYIQKSSVFMGFCLCPFAHPHAATCGDPSSPATRW